MRRLCLDVFEGIPHETLLPLVKAAGFDGFCSGWTFGNDLEAMSTLLTPNHFGRVTALKSADIKGKRHFLE